MGRFEWSEGHAPRKRPLPPRRRRLLVGVAVLVACVCTLVTLAFAVRSRGRLPATSLLEFGEGTDYIDSAVPEPLSWDMEKFDTAQVNVQAYEQQKACRNCMWNRCKAFHKCGRFFQDNQGEGYDRSYCMCGCCRRQCGLPRWCPAVSPYPSNGILTHVYTLPLTGDPIVLPAQTALSDDGATLYVADEQGHSVKAINLETGVVRTVAGTGEIGLADADPNNPGKLIDGFAAKARFNHPRGLALLPGVAPTQLVVADTGNNLIRIITDPDSPAANVSTLAGDGTEDLKDGWGEEAAFASPMGLAAAKTADGRSVVFVADTRNDAIRLITIDDGMTSTVAGEYTFPPHDGPVDGLGSFARFSGPTGIAVSKDGTRLFVADAGNHAIRAIDNWQDLPDEGPPNRVTTIAGNGQHGEEEGHSSTFFTPRDIAVHPSGDRLEITDSQNHIIRMLDLNRCDSAGVNCFTMASAGMPGVHDEIDGKGPAARFDNPTTITALPQLREGEARFVVSDTGGKNIRIVTMLNQR